MKAKQTQNARDKQSVSFAKSSSGIVSQFKEPQPIVIKGELQPASLHNLTCTRIRIPLNAASAAAFLSCFPLHIRISPTTQHFALNLPHICSRIRILLCSQRVSYFILLHLHSTTATSPFVLFRSLPSFPLPHSHSHAPYPTLWLLPPFHAETLLRQSSFFRPASSVSLSLPLSPPTALTFASHVFCIFCGCVYTCVCVCVAEYLPMAMFSQCMRVCVCVFMCKCVCTLTHYCCCCWCFHMHAKNLTKRNLFLLVAFHFCILCQFFPTCSFSLFRLVLAFVFCLALHT